MDHYDIIIIGNGMVGASLACALIQFNLKIAIIDKKPIINSCSETKKFDGRKIALSYSSHKILQVFNVWPLLEQHATMIKQVHISQKNYFGATRISAIDFNIDALGYVVPAEKLQQALQSTLTNDIEYFCPATINNIQLSHKPIVNITYNEQQKDMSTNLLVAADGVLSYSRKQLNIETIEKDYQQSAFVANIQLQRTHNNIAYQRFTDSGTLAMLPMQNNHCGFVWTMNNNNVDELMQLNDNDLLEKIQNQFGYRLGKLNIIGKRFSYPVKMIIAKQQTKKHFLLIGNAAHNISPIMAQGFNLALQDINCLVKLIINNKNDYQFVLTEYVKQREPKQQQIITLTDRVTTWCDGNNSLSHLKGFSLAMLDLIPAAKNYIAQFFSGTDNSQ